MSTTRHFAAELLKLAFLKGKVPIIPTSQYSHQTITGSGVPMHAMKPLSTFKPPKPAGIGKSPSIPAAKKSTVKHSSGVPSIQRGTGDRPSSGVGASGMVR